MHIIETTANQFYRVWETGSSDLDHVWYGLQVKLVKGQWIDKAKSGRAKLLPELIRKAGTKTIVSN